MELENDARNTTDDSSFEGMMIACIGRLKNKLCKRKEKSLYSTRKNPFSPTTIYKKQRRECAMITYTLKHTHTHTHTNLHAYGEKNLQIHPHHQDGIKQHHHEAFLKEKQKEKTKTTFPCRRRSKAITH